MRVLIVEDYPPLRESLTQGIQEAGFAVDSSADGEEGLWYAQSNEYDAIILDVMLPKIDGVSALRQIRESGNQAPVLLLTAMDAVSDRVAGLEAGADDYLTKPFAFDELLARVRALTRRKYDKPAPVIRVCDLEVNTAEKIVRRKGKIIELTAPEYIDLTP